MEKELQKMEPKKWIQRYQIRGRDPLFIDTLSKLWPSDQKQFGHSGLCHVISQQYVV